MIRINNLSLPIGWEEAQLKKRCALLLGAEPEDFTGVTLARQSIDARKKSDVHYVCTVDLTAPDEAELVRRAQNKNVTLHTPQPYLFPSPRRTSPQTPVVVGMGPAGLFAALFLARGGVAPIVLERGRPVERRSADVDAFWRSGVLDPASNVQFGEGGAGTFSDGKLTTGTRDPRLTAVLEEFIAHGAPPDVRWSHRPHIGTDVLRDVVKSIRAELIALGCDVRFEHRLTGLELREGGLRALTVEGPQGAYSLETDALILAPGHSARDTFRMLFEAGVPMEAKGFAMGVRMEHSQSEINLTQYGPEWGVKLPPSDYKLACHLPNGRSAFSFCVCPGGQVVAAASEPGSLAINGMSFRARDEANCNGGLLVGVTPADFGSSHPLAGMEFQTMWEERAFQLGGGGFIAPVQTVGSLLGRVGKPTLDPTYRPGVVFTNLDGCLPPYVAETLRGAIPLMARRLRGFDSPGAVLTGVETRSSSPVRLSRGADFQSPVRGLYPCGEGGGWAGGIMSAAADGIRVAEAVALGDPDTI